MRHPRADISRYELTADTVRSLLNYDADSGRFVWRPTCDRPTNWNRRYAGKEAGYVNSLGRRVIGVMSEGKKFRYSAASLAWLIMTGQWPQTEIDHIDTEQANDRWSNLRAATSSQNKCNRKVNPRSATGIKGVSQHRAKFQARIKFGATYRVLGSFVTIEEAAAAYAVAAAELHGEFARLA